MADQNKETERAVEDSGDDMQSKERLFASALQLAAVAGAPLSS